MSDFANADSQSRKDTPIYSGALMYFPDAIAAVARLSKKANDKHNPGEPMHWAKGKSNDHPDCVVRHLMTPRALDEFGEYHAVAAAWRALAFLQSLYDEDAENDDTPIKQEPEYLPSLPAATPDNPLSEFFQIVNPLDMGLSGELEGKRFFGVWDEVYAVWRVNAGPWSFNITRSDLAHAYVRVAR